MDLRSLNGGSFARLVISNASAVKRSFSAFDSGLCSPRTSQRQGTRMKMKKNFLLLPPGKQVHEDLCLQGGRGGGDGGDGSGGDRGTRSMAAE